jgi:hypothetical protein
MVRVMFLDVAIERELDHVLERQVSAEAVPCERLDSINLLLKARTGGESKPNAFLDRETLVPWVKITADAAVRTSFTSVTLLHQRNLELLTCSAVPGAQSRLDR